MNYLLITQYLPFQATTDLYGNCTLRHSGTSAAAPEAAGVFALALEAKYVSSKRQRASSEGWTNMSLHPGPGVHGGKSGCESLWSVSIN